MEGFKVEKSTCEKYTIRWGHYGWAVFTIDENGLFSCQSDYGNYQYMWPNHGRKSFKHFILDLVKDKQYFLGKVARESYFNFDKSLKNWKKAIIEMRMDGECTKQQAREAWDFITGLDDYSMSADLITGKIYESKEIYAICPDEPWYVFEVIKEYPPQAVMFANEVMPMFGEIIQKEIDQQLAS